MDRESIAALSDLKRRAAEAGLPEPCEILAAAELEAGSDIAQGSLTDRRVYTGEYHRRLELKAMITAFLRPFLSYRLL